MDLFDDVAVTTNISPYFLHLFAPNGQARSPPSQPAHHEPATSGAGPGCEAQGVPLPSHAEPLGCTTDPSAPARRSVFSPLSLLQWTGAAVASAIHTLAPGFGSTTSLSATSTTRGSKRGRNEADDEDDDGDDDKANEEASALPVKKKARSNSQVRFAYTDRWVKSVQKGTPLVVNFGPTFALPSVAEAAQSDDEMDDSSTASDSTPRPVHGAPAVDAMDVDDSADQSRYTSTSQHSSNAYFGMDDIVSARASVHVVELTACVQNLVQRLRHASILRFRESQYDLGRMLMNPAVRNIAIVVGLQTRPSTLLRLLRHSASPTRGHVAIVGSLQDGFATIALALDNGQLLVFPACSTPALSQLPDTPPLLAAPEVTLGDELDHKQLGALAGGSEPLRATVLRIVITGADIDNIFTYRWLLLRLPNVTRVVFALSAACGPLQLVVGEVQLPLSARHILHILMTVVDCADTPTVEIEEDIVLQDMNEFGAALKDICRIRRVPTARFSM
ncbi:hypothetical protein EXIGLDRAFT_154018 [Exidia glandulosa HHB12029]|uniref:Uncharacterized protein n=1 Tax=Exidia glandulosa HHB12029 TaxID=1314781 RepID=A0A165QHB7_EXIGL|nr:hypothetical protein EXIGLDRAFT_154018 [Exidia glandulosa HHB12029]